MNRWAKLFENPVFIKEMRVGFREKKVFFALTAWIIIVALFASISAASSLSDHVSISELPETGKMIFEMLFWVQLVLLMMLAPSLTTSAVSGERERQSFDMLLTTHLAPSELIFGKFGFAASFILLALFSTVPLEAIVFFLGGVSLASFFYAKLILAVLGMMASLFGLMLSARETRSAYATGQAYFGLVFLFFFGMPFIIALRYADNAPTAAYALIVITAIYLTLFLFWKAVNLLEERARHIKILLTLGVVFYLILVGTALYDDYLWQDMNDSLWFAYGPVHYLLMGILLNPALPKRQRERDIFQKSLLSRPALWTGLLGLGCFLPLIYGPDTDFVVCAVYTALAGLGTALFARGMSIKKPSRYPFILGFSWLLLNVLPGFTAINGFSGGDRMLHPAGISPFVFLVSSYDNGWSGDFPILALGFYAVLMAAGLIFSARKRTT